MTPVSLTSVPLVSASLLNLIPIVAFINDQIIKATMKTKILIDKTPINCAPKVTPELVAGTIKVPQIPANK